MTEADDKKSVVGSRHVHAVRKGAGRLLMAIPFALALGGWGWSTFSDPYRSHLVTDLIILAGVAVFVWGIHRAWFGAGPRRLNRWLTAYAALGLWWVLLSASSAVTSAPLPVDSNRFSDSWSHPQPIELDLEWQDQSLAVALSGGGYRAAVFHAGALDTLERLGLQPTHMSTVSGGSIIGSYYWRGGSPIDFKNAVANARFNFKRKAFTFPTTLMFLLPSFSRLDVQAELLDDVLLDGVWHKSIDGANQPNLAINATDLSHGLQLGFLDNHVFITGPLTVLVNASEADSSQLRLSERVAISGAFPGAFPSADLSVTPPAATDEQRELLLVDGGIGDNTGYELMTRLAKYACGNQSVDEWCLEENDSTDLVSDGGAVFAVKSDMNMLGQLSQMFDVSLRLRESWLARIDRADVSVTPHQAFFSVRESFSYPGGKDKLNDDGVGFRNFPFDPLLYPVVILEELGALLPDSDDQQAFTRHLAAFVRSSDFHATNRSATPANRLFSYNSHGMAPPHHLRSYEECVARLDNRNPNPELCEAVGMRLLVLEQLEKDMWVFADTDTLVDTFAEERADAIFRAGQFMVLLRWHALLRNMGPPTWIESMRNRRGPSSSPVDSPAGATE
ncbi:MAG: patatin-like phospholipase family protein [Woeseiaceae bacterium]|nr:patatin-like phospholipase family protein [Woeseiaceae bacterium]